MTDNIYQNNDAPQMSEEEIVEHIWRQAIANGDDPNRLIGNAYYDGLYGLRQDAHTAMTYYKRSADGGHAKGQFNYALSLARGDGGYDDLQLALDYASKAAAQGLDRAIYLAKDIQYVLANYNYVYFVDPWAGNVARYDEWKHWFVMKRCYDTEAEANVDGTKAGEEEDLNSNCFIHPWAFGNSYSPLNEALYESFGTHWGVNPINGDVWMDDEAAGQFSAVGYDVDGTDNFKRVSTSQLMDNLASMQKPTDTFFYLLSQAQSGKADTDELKALGESYASGYYGLSDFDTCKENYEPATHWLMEAYKKGSDDALRYLYKLNYFRDRIIKIVHNPEPVDNEDEVMASAATMTGEEVFDLAQRYALGKDVPRNYAVSARLLQVAVDKGNAAALYTLAGFKFYCYLDDNYDTGEIVNDYQRAYEMGWPAAAEKAADMAFLNLDLDNAEKYYKLAGEQGNAECMLHYVEVKDMQAHIAEEDVDEAMKAIIRSLPQDNAVVLDYIGDMYHDGMFGVTVDYEKAWDYYSRAAGMQGISDDVRMVFGNSLPFTTIGFGPDYDFPLPKEPLRGFSESMHQMAAMIVLGQHGDPERDHDQAMQLLNEAVERVNPDSILLRKAILGGADEEEVERLARQEYNNDELSWFVDTCSLLGDAFSTGWNHLGLYVLQMAEQVGDEETVEE